jgi:HAD superfamily hydrolase (TIGR01509 family)
MLAPKAIVFDLDGVLLDSERIWRVAFDRYATSLGRTDGSELFDLALGRRRVDCLPDLAAAVARPPEEVERGLNRAMRSLIVDGRLREMPAAKETVRELARGWTLGLASSSVRGFVDEALALISIEDCFRYTLSGDEVERGKPHPEMYLRMADLLGVRAGDCVAIEDSPAGVTAAVAAGMTCIGVHVEPGVAVEAHHLVPDLRAARRLLSTVGTADEAISPARD